MEENTNIKLKIQADNKFILYYPTGGNSLTAYLNP